MATTTAPALTGSAWLIYGANGYTGEKIAREAVQRGLRPILAGRSDRVRQLATELGLMARVFGLDDAAAVQANLDGIAVVLHCAGPFSATAAPMIEGCLATGTHYLDITGEIAVFEAAKAQSDRASARGIVLCPGVGFDVVPTDGLAASLAAVMPDATHLALGFDSYSPFSRGTAKSSVEGMAQGGRVRRDGRIVAVPLAYRVREIDFGRGLRSAMTIPWGDVATAFHSTGIPNIECYLAVPATAVRRIRLLRWAMPLLAWAPLQRYLKRRIDHGAAGPTDAQLTKLTTWVWGEVRNARGDVRVGRVTTANGYVLTVYSALAAVRSLLAQAPLKSGYATPSQLFGAALVEQLPGSGRIRITTE